MNSAVLDTEYKRKSSMPKMKDSWPLYSGKEPSLEELDESIKKLTPEQVDRILFNAGVIDEAGYLTEIYV